MFDRYYLTKRNETTAVITVVHYFAGLMIALAVSLIILIGTKVPIEALYDEIFIQVFINPDGQARTLPHRTARDQLPR